MLISWIIGISIYTFLILLISSIIYFKNQVFYRPLQYINPETSKKINVHKLYPEFACLDNNSFFRIFIAFYFYAIPRFLINVFFAVRQIIQLKRNMKKLKNPTTDPDEWSIMSNIISKWTHYLLKINCINVKRIKVVYHDIYKKYLGEDYQFNNDEKYSLIISNHIGFYDVVLNMAINKCGFLAKEEAKDYLLPEGTTTNGKYILKFKRGAFYNLLPVKPQVMTLGNDKLNYSAAIGVGSTGWNYWRSLCYFGCNINVYDLPVIKPTEYMFEKFSYLGTEKWEIFAEVTRKIMCEIGQLPPSDKSYRNSKKYEDSLRKGEYEEEENKQLLEVKS